MYRKHQKPRISRSSSGQKIRLVFCAFLLIACAARSSAQQQPSKIQQVIDSTKETYSNEESDYITDGQHIVWVKSYKKWTPEDFNTIKKEASYILKFLSQAIAHNRMDVLEQLLPDYYRYRGGVEAFAADIQKVN